MHKPIAEQIPSKNYSKVIKVNVPVIFYWDKENKFDGIALEINGKPTNTADNISIFQLLDKLQDYMSENG